MQLPHRWSRHVRSSLVHAVSMANVVFTITQTRVANHFDARVRMQADLDHREREISLLLEEIRIKDARMERVPAQRRPHYRTDRHADSHGSGVREYSGVVRTDGPRADCRADARQDVSGPSPGKWTGGMPPLGYDVAPEGGRLVPNKDEASTVQSIFELYLEMGSLLAVVRQLRRLGWRRKTWTTRDGRLRVGRDWNNVDLHRVMTNPLYAGMQKLRGETFKGEHPAIVPKTVFDQVQRLLEQNRRNSGAAHRNRHGALLRGILRCAACDSAMTHAFTQRHGKAFRYYRCITR